MPIVNATQAVWLTTQIWLPYSQQSTTAVASTFSTKQISNRTAATDVIYGFPYEKIWDIGNTYWETNITFPLLVTEDNIAEETVVYNSVSVFADFVKYMLATSGFKGGDAFTANTLKNKWDFFQTDIISSSNVDFVIQKIALDISEDESSFTVSIISTSDLRETFNVTNHPFTKAPTEGVVFRLVQPYDITIPTGCIGSRLGFTHNSIHSLPTRTTEDLEYTSMLRDFHLTLEASVTQVPTIGVPTSRAFLGITSLKSTGSMKYVPLYKGTNITFQPDTSTFAPAGWVVDLQAIDYLSDLMRKGGKLYVEGATGEELYIQLYLKNNGYILNGIEATTPIGPVSTSSWGLDISGGQFNAVDVEFVTSPGLISF